ncbi:MAG TPA: O-methyltransferase [Streptosporangiaceae bacterium]|nr:O-methyltransferase [Streptosporangiaceae bacterium]
MARSNEHVSPLINDYIAAHTSPPDAVLLELAGETAARFPGEDGMQIGPEQGTFMTLLTRLMRARDAIEIGTFTGYSSICVARGLGEGGKLLCCDVSEEWTSVARRYWEKAGVADRIELRIGPGLDTLRALPEGVTFDLAFIDADKTGYIGYWDEVVPHIRPGGAILVDNTLLHGRVIDESDDGDRAVAMRAFNEHAVSDERVVVVLLPIGDGLTLAWRK